MCHWEPISGQDILNSSPPFLWYIAIYQNIFILCRRTHQKVTRILGERGEGQPQNVNEATYRLVVPSVSVTDVVDQLPIAECGPGTSGREDRIWWQLLQWWVWSITWVTLCPMHRDLIFDTEEERFWIHCFICTLNPELISFIFILLSSLEWLVVGWLLNSEKHIFKIPFPLIEDKIFGW